MNPIRDIENLTVPLLLRNVVKNIHQPDRTFLKRKVKDEWEEISFRTTLDNADKVSSYFLDNGITKGDRIGFLLENSPEYVFFDQGAQQIGAVNTSVYPTLSETEIEYILKDSGIKMLLVGSPFLLKKVIKIANNCANLIRIVVTFEDYGKITENTSLNAGILSLNSLLDKGSQQLTKYQKQIEIQRNDVMPSDLSALIYTSGTTGTPKGAMLTHYNFVENVRECLNQIPVIVPEDVFLSFLPLSHVFERTATYHVCCAMGCQIAFAQSLELLAKNMEEVKPMVISCVPRLLEKIHDKAIKSGTSAGGTKAKIFLWALDIGQKYREVNEAGKTPGIKLSLQYAIAKKLVFSKIIEKTGGRLKFMISGGAALPRNVGEFFGNLGIKILEGFGLTETSPVMSVTEYNRQVYGTVGRIIPGIEVGIQDVETKEFITIQTYRSFNPDFTSEEGEICVRGHCVMKGYWNKPEETALVIDAEGWFHTGDVGRFFRGNLQITDRIKNMLVNAYGKNIYPTPVENTYLKSQKIESVFLIGDKKEYVSAIITPSRETLQETFNLPNAFFDESDEVFIEDTEIRKWIEEDLKKYAQELAKFERIKTFKLKRNPFSMEEGEITPTLKPKRKVIEKKYHDIIEELYSEDTEQ
ncbi:AMP-dependent synthetase/ligase [Pseudopedobacter beijingensis]|uniref:AMP-dependent synthetase/ligase n=1 Tax=Pseudopedobacter beijingensis TaxID=1207056 RepID=A0ABW4IEZ8_9SPHI